MKPMTVAEAQAVKGGAFSGAILTGVAAIIESFSNLITNIGGMAFAFSQPQHVQGEVSFNKNFSFSWDDNKLLSTTPAVINKWTNHNTNNQSLTKPNIWNFQ